MLTRPNYATLGFHDIQWFSSYLWPIMQEVPVRRAGWNCAAGFVSPSYLKLIVPTWLPSGHITFNAPNRNTALKRRGTSSEVGTNQSPLYHTHQAKCASIPDPQNQMIFLVTRIRTHLGSDVALWAQRLSVGHCATWLCYSE